MERPDSGVKLRRHASPDTVIRPAEPVDTRVTHEGGDEYLGGVEPLQGVDVRRRAQDVSVHTAGPELYLPPEVPGSFGDTLADAWADYEAGAHERARDLFGRAARSPDPAIRNEANLGRALCWAGMGDNEQAAALLRALVAEGYRPEQTVPALVRAVVGMGDLAGARQLLGQIPDPGARAELAREIRRREVRGRLAGIRRETSGPGLARLLADNRDLLSRCVEPYLFLDAASRVGRLGEIDTAVSVLRALLECRDRDGTLRVEVLRQLVPLLPFREAVDLLEQERVGVDAGAGGEERIVALERDLLEQRMNDPAVDFAAYRRTAERILELEPTQDGVRNQLAWACLNAGQTACALEQFSFLVERDPARSEYAAGKCEALLAAGRLEDALLWLEQTPAAEDPELGALHERVARRKGILLFESGDHPGAEPYLALAHARDPSDPDLRELLAWTYYHTGDLQAAQRVFLESFHEAPSEAGARNVLMTFRQLGEDRRASRWTRGLASSSDPLLRRIAADSYHDLGWPIQAAQTFSGPQTCYVNCDAVWAEASPYGRWRTGDPGLSRFIEAGLPVGVRVPWRRGLQWRFTLIPAWLHSGEAPPNPYAGSYYRFIAQPSMVPRSLRESAWVLTPEAVLEGEGTVTWQARLGTTPLGGTVAPLPTFQVQAGRGHDWRVAVHQCPVRESMLSYVGQRDPYAVRDWGRVLRTGVEAAKTLWNRAPYWVSLEAGYDYYWGERTVDNHRAGGTLSAGRTGPLSVGELSVGALVFGQHFQRNTNFFTFGHGGYFSPQAYVMAGPFARFVTKPCRNIWIDARMSLGYVYYETGRTPQYRGTRDDPSVLTPDAQANEASFYQSESRSSFGLSARVDGLKLVGERWALGGFAGVNTATDHVEIMGGASVRFFFRPRETLCFTTGVFQGGGTCP